MFSTLLGLLFWLTPLDTGSMLSASMEAHVAANSTVIVTARYRLHKPAGPSSLTLRTLHPFETAPGAISVDVGGEPASLTLLPAASPRASLLWYRVSINAGNVRCFTRVKRGARTAAMNQYARGNESTNQPKDHPAV